ncbi:hypothetical protein G6F36_013968 [Rhizopus arrhizus]|nr:hypothetical protein G6F36_013968 [Rhizopus arrhizus]
MEEEDIGEQTEVTLDSTQDLSLGIFTREGTAVGIVSPLQPAIQTLPLTTINSNNVTTTITTTTTTTTNTTTTTATTDTTYSTELLDSSRWHPSRGSPDQILQQLEENNQTPMAIETNPGGMPDSICKDSKAMVLAKKIYPRRRTKGNKYCRRKIPNCRNNRKVYRSKSKRLPFQVFHPSGSHQEKTNSGLSQVQPIYPGRALQDGRSISLERPNRAKRLHGETRFTRCIYRSTNPSKFKSIFSVRKPWHSLPVQSAELWTKCRSKNFFKNTSICNRVFKKRRHKNGILFRRYLYFVTRPSRPTTKGSKGNHTSRITRLHYQQKREFINTISYPGVFRV